MKQGFKIKLHVLERHFNVISICNGINVKVFVSVFTQVVL